MNSEGPHVLRVALIGRPGCGKGTVSRGLAQATGAVELSSGELMRREIDADSELGNDLFGYINAGKLAPDKYAVQLIQVNLAKPEVAKNGYILDGFPRNLAQAEALETLLTDLRLPLQIVVDIAVSRAVAKERLMNRRRAGETEETIEKRLDGFEITTVPVIAHYESLGLLHRVDGEGAPDDVIAQTLKAVGL